MRPERKIKMVSIANPTAPHACIIYFKAEIREKLPTGEFSGNVAYSTGTKPLFFKFEADDRDIAIRMLNELIDKLKKGTV